jgi:hypothetical protein
MWSFRYRVVSHFRRTQTSIRIIDYEFYGRVLLSMLQREKNVKKILSSNRSGAIPYVHIKVHDLPVISVPPSNQLSELLNMYLVCRFFRNNRSGRKHGRCSLLMIPRTVVTAPSLRKVWKHTGRAMVRSFKKKKNVLINVFHNIIAHEQTFLYNSGTDT